ncbi:uncharacterized protein LOC106175433 isoform X2 [Lingula anatina]|uniref:Uncharacterized protein LOC106175433 isoform X2 n=1 Tax=Lingula anatina TaxID=7574 RepID=A0A1S3JR80_LINAN|nr:uncharacterized protein LOC106175433 isoform X2 [Lingula anatina]XP_013412890.1 uncharacterized protein LOC106175433 isoform X2 [Lingula anatina]|eukprot:XP_013412889.1 uncharacterized protein LOC106175433 isoform X2 [Lingula anatina]
MPISTFLPVLTGDEMECHSMKDPLGVALFGLGRAGMIHFLNLIRCYRVQLKYIIDLDIPKIKQLLIQYHQRHTVALTPEEAEKVYNDESVGAVFVCSPTFTHQEIVQNALRKGKGVFCEKPISQDIAGTEACYVESEKAGKPLFCSFNRRYDPSIRGVLNGIEEQNVGDIHMVKMCSRDSPLPPMSYLKISGGIFHDCAVHDIDVICWILHQYPVSVYAQGHAHIKAIAEMDDVDTVAITMKFPSGALAMIDLSRNASYGYDQRLEVFGTKGMLVSENQRCTGVQHSCTTGTSLAPMHFSFPQRYADSYVLAMEHFLNVMEEKEAMEITKESTLTISKIATACEESYKLGKPVELFLTQPEGPTLKSDTNGEMVTA